MANKRPIVAADALKEHADTDSVICGQGIIFAEQSSAPSTPSSGYGIWYVKTDGLLYFKNDAGTETLLS